MWAIEGTDLLSAKEQKLLEQIEAVVSNDGVEVVTLEILGAKRAPIVRVYIDTPFGVNFDVLSTSQSKIGDLLDDIDPFPGAYTLEVSSPGIDRPLRTSEHFERFLGSKAQIKCIKPIDGRSRFKGIIKEVVSGGVCLDCDGEIAEIPFEFISRANIIGEISFS